MPRARSANAATLALVEIKFEEPIISWKVAGVGWSAVLSNLVVWYCDVAMATDLKLDEDEINLARKNRH
jgi:hypothetical protein